MRKRDLLKGVAGIAMLGALPYRAFGAKDTTAPAFRKRLNLLFITADDMDWSVLGFMGGGLGLTPNLDALAAQSHLFANNRTVAPICMPSRQAFMSGLLPHHNGGTGFIPMKDGTPTLTTILQEQGYYAAAIHKIEHMQPFGCFPWDYMQNGKDRHILVHSRGLAVAIDEARAASKPFFVQCNINDPHRPFYGSAEAAKLDHDDQGPYRIAREIRPEDVTVPAMLEDLPPVRAELAQYWNSAQRMDAAIGNILKTLAESGEADSTVIVFCADHGMPFPFSKATCYDHGTRVPVLIRWPGMGAPRRFENLTTNLDILPTVLDILGIAPPPALDGRSWLPIVRGERDKEPEFVFTYVNEVASGMAYPARAAQDRRYSLIFSPWADGKLAMRLESMTGLSWPAMLEAAKSDSKVAARVRQYVYGIPLALYDLQEDAGQRRNLIDAPEHASRVARMKAVLLAEMERTADPQLDNFRALLAGRQPVVLQQPERYRMRGGD